MALFGRRSKKDKTAAAAQEQPVTAAADHSDVEIAAAIAVALRMYSYQTLAAEETIITIQRVIRPYSPWNSKIYNMKQMPQRVPSRPRSY